MTSTSLEFGQFRFGESETTHEDEDQQQKGKCASPDDNSKDLIQSILSSAMRRRRDSVDRVIAKQRRRMQSLNSQNEEGGVAEMSDMMGRLQVYEPTIAATESTTSDEQGSRENSESTTGSRQPHFQKSGR